MDWKKIGKKLLFPPIWLMVLLTIASAALLTMVFIKHWEQRFVANFIYVLAFYTLMSLFMTELGTALGGLSMVLGIIIGIIGMVLVALAYPVYNRVLKKERERIAPEILRLTDDLLK